MTWMELLNFMLNGVKEGQILVDHKYLWYTKYHDKIPKMNNTLTLDYRKEKAREGNK